MERIWNETFLRKQFAERLKINVDYTQKSCVLSSTLGLHPRRGEYNDNILNFMYIITVVISKLCNKWNVIFAIVFK